MTGMKVALLFVWTWLLVGCLPSSTATMNGPALVHPKFPYAVTFDDEKKKSLMGEDWKLETHRRVTAARSNAMGSASEPGSSSPDPGPGRTDSITKLERKTGYEFSYELDFDDDDKTDANVKLPGPDLLLLNKRTSARLEVATVLLDERLAQKELRVLLNEIVESGNGTHSIFTGVKKGTAAVHKHYAARLVESAEASLGGQSGLVATIEQANLDELELNPNALWRRSRLFLVHAPFDYYVEATPDRAAPSGMATGGLSQAEVAKLRSDEYRKYGVLLMVEYSNEPDDFEPQYPEFLRLLGKLHPMNDERLMNYLQASLQDCRSDSATTASLRLRISPVGRASIERPEGLDTECAAEVASRFPFAATGEVRVITGKFDFKQPAELGWLTASEYIERPRRAAPPAEPAEPTPAQPPSESVAPSAPPATAPAPAPPPTPAPSPPTPSAGPGPTSAPATTGGDSPAE